MEEVIEFNLQEVAAQFMHDNFTIFMVAIVFILLDIITGVVTAIYNRDFSSTIMRRGLAHKLGYIFIMCAVAILQVGMFDTNFHIDFEFPLFNIVCGFVILMEFLSIVENACILNPQLDKLLGKYLAQSYQEPYFDEITQPIPTFDVNENYVVREDD